jgi:hypothetical protein
VFVGLARATTGELYAALHTPSSPALFTRNAVPTRSKTGSSRKPAGVKTSQPRVAPGTETRKNMIAPTISRLCRLRSGVRPRHDPTAMPAATWPGVPSEFKALTKLWISLTIAYTAGR